MSPRKYNLTVRRKKGQTGPLSTESFLFGERRRHPRFNVELPLDYSIENNDHYAGVAANASKGGLVAYLPAALVVGTSMNIEIIFAKGFELNSIRARAKVIWSNLASNVTWGEYRYGLKFEDFQEGDIQKLKGLLKEAAETRSRKRKNELGGWVSGPETNK